MEDAREAQDTERTSEGSVDNNKEQSESRTTWLFSNPFDEPNMESKIQPEEETELNPPTGKSSQDNEESKGVEDQISTTETNAAASQDQQADKEIPSPKVIPETSAVKEPEPETEPQKEKVATRTVSPKQRIVKRKAAEKFKVKSVRIREVYIETCHTEDETLQMQPEMKRRMQAILGDSNTARKNQSVGSNVELLLENCDKDSDKKPEVVLPSVFTCPRCDEQFLSLKSFRSHSCKSEVQQKGLYSCTECEGKFDSKGHLMNHMASYHISKQRRNFTCRFCQEMFMQRSKLNQHEKTVHGEHMVYSCEHCSDTYMSRIELSRHEKSALHGDWYALRPNKKRIKGNVKIEHRK